MRRFSWMTRRAVLLAVACFTAAGCSQASGTFGKSEDVVASGEAPSERAMPAKDPPPGSSIVRPVADKRELANVAHDQRIVVYTASLTIVVGEIPVAVREMEKIAAGFGGYVQSMRGDSITIRVPVKIYQDAVASVEKLGSVSRKEMEAADVTDEFVDLEARLKNAIGVRTRLEALLAKAEDVKAALEVERELGRVTEEIERLQAKLEIIRNRVALSTIAVNFERVYRSLPGPEKHQLPFAWLQRLDPRRLTQTYGMMSH